MRVADVTRPEKRGQYKPVPVELLRELEARGLSMTEMAQEVLDRTGLRVSPDILRAKLCQFGIRARRYRHQEVKTDGVRLTRGILLDAEDRKILERLDNDEAGERAERDWLLSQGQAGDVGALICLKELYRLRLPLVEARISVTLPWMRKNGTGHNGNGNGNGHR